MTITASVVTYHTPLEDVDNLLSSVENSIIDVIYMVDNSADNSLQAYVSKYPKVRYIKNNNNGYGGGHNVAIRRAFNDNPDFHIVINPDIFWEGPAIQILANFMEQHPECGLVIPKVCNLDGRVTEMCRMLPTPYDLILRRFIPLKNWKAKNDNEYLLKFTGYNRVMEVPTVSGCFMFLRMSKLKEIDGFDERFFMYLEDVDLSRRMGEVATVMFCPETQISHVAAHGSYKNLKLLKYHISSANKYFNKWGWFFDPKRNSVNNKCKAQFSEGD